MKSAKWAILLCLAAAPAAAADCQSLKANFDEAVRAKQGEAIQKAFDAIDLDVRCGFHIDDFRAPAIDAAIDALRDPAQAATRQATLDFVTLRIGVVGRWQLDERLGDYFFNIGDKGDAKSMYEEGLNAAAGHPKNPLGPKDMQRLVQKASGAWILASDDREGRASGQVLHSVTRDGSEGGVFLALERGAVAVRAPIPINFKFGLTEFTDVGIDAARELAKAMHEQGVTAIKLVGHADPRGDKAFNLDLSRRRAEALKAFLTAELVKAGDSPVIHTEGVGDAQPFDVTVLPNNLSQEEIYALDRRVEFARE